MNLYITILLEFLLISSSILLLFKFRKNLGLAPLYILLGSVQYLQASLGSSFSFNFFLDYEIHPGSIILFSGVLFAVLLIYIKEGVASARALIVGIILSSIIMTLMFEITFLQEVIDSETNNSVLNPESVFKVNFNYFLSGTAILLLDFLLIIILFQYLVSKIKKIPFFLNLFISLFSILIFDALAFNFALFYGTPNFETSLVSHLIGKSIAALLYSILLYFYIKYFDKEVAKSATFIANQDRDIFSIIKYRKRYEDLKVEKKQAEARLTSQLATSLHNISDGFISLDTNWCYTYINKKAADLIGKSPASLIGKHIWTEFSEGVGSDLYKAYHRAFETQKTTYFENYDESLDKWFENRVYPSPEGLTIYFTDITEKKKADTTNQVLLSLIETSDDFVGLADLEGKPTYLNVNGKKLVGLDANDELPKSIQDFFPEDYRDKIVTEHMPTLFENSKWIGEVKFQNFKTDHIIPIEMSGFLIRDVLSNNPIAMGIVASDITNRIKSEEDLKNSELLLRRLTSNVPVGIFQTDKKGSCNYVNEQWTEYAGLSFEEGMGFGWANAIHPDDRERVVQEWQQTIISETDFVSDFRFQNKNNKIVWLSGKAVRLFNAQNNLYGYIGMVSDITERKEAEEQIKRSEKYLENIINNIGDPVFVKDEQSRMILVNDAFCSIFNLARADIIGKTLAKNLPPEEMEIFLRIDKQVILTGIENVNEETLTIDENETRIVSTKKTRFIDSGDNTFLIGTVRDITEQIAAEEYLKETHSQLSMAVESAKLGVWSFTFNTGDLVWNEELFKIYGVDPAEFDNTMDAFQKLVHPEDLEYVMSQQGTVSGLEFRIIRPNKEVRYISGSFSQVMVNGEVTKIIGINEDVTERKKTETELQNHRNNLEELVELRTSELEREKVKAQSADLMKSAFLATMSHELRTPMNSIIGFTSILLKEFAGPLNEEQKKQLSMVKTSGHHLLGLINDVLDISKIEAGKLKVSLYPFNYLITLEKTIDFLLPQASKKGLLIDSEISEIEITLNSDERRVEQILLNLLSNAIKFSNSGTINVKVGVVDNMLVTQVIDQGIGISKKDLNKLFIPFIQLEGGLNRSHEGTGLGLAICKNLIEKLGGTIHVKSKKGEGSNFTFKLPLEQIESK